MSVVSSQPRAPRVWTMTRQIGAESAQTAACCSKSPTEAGGEGILLVLCTSPASKRVHAFRRLFPLSRLDETKCFHPDAAPLNSQRRVQELLMMVDSAYRATPGANIIEQHNMHLFRGRWRSSWPVWAAGGEKELLRLWRRPSNGALSSRSEYQFTRSDIEFCLRRGRCQFNAHPLRHTNTILCLGSMHSKKPEGPMVKINGLDLLESSLQQSQKCLNKLKRSGKQKFAIREIFKVRKEIDFKWIILARLFGCESKLCFCRPWLLFRYLFLIARAPLKMWVLISNKVYI